MNQGRREEFSWTAPGDFIRLDALCAELLQDFFRWLHAPQGPNLPASRATPLARAADRYLRDFAVDIAEAGPADADPSLPRCYLSNWYIVHTLTPSHAEIDQIQEALLLLYRYLGDAGITDAGTVGAAREGLLDAEYFHARLESFWNLSPEAISGWRAVDEHSNIRRASPV